MSPIRPRVPVLLRRRERSLRCWNALGGSGLPIEFRWNGGEPTMLLLNQLSHYGVKCRSLEDQWIDSWGAVSDAVIGILATVAKFEAERLSCRVRSGLERARSQCKILGRPLVVMDRSRLAKLRDQGFSLREIAARTGKSTMTVQRALKALG